MHGHAEPGRKGKEVHEDPRDVLNGCVLYIRETPDRRLGRLVDFSLLPGNRSGSWTPIQIHTQ